MVNFSLEFSPEALEEIRHIIRYYNDVSPKLGNVFKRNLLASLKSVKGHPTYNSFRYDEVRFACVKKFPYAAHYTIDETKKVVKIQAVLSFSQNPDTNWRIRF
jgi:plasmid stabilization system protein ParE